MSDALAGILDKLFENLPYSKAFLEVKAQVGTSMEREYQALTAGGSSHLNALGQILCQYGDPVSAAALAGTQLPVWKELPITEKRFSRIFRSVSLCGLLSACFLCGLVSQLRHGILTGSLWRFLAAAVCGVLGVLLLLPFRGHWNGFAYDRVILTPEARNRFRLCLDRVRVQSRLVLLLYAALIAHFVYLYWRQPLPAILPELLFCLGGAVCGRYAVGALFLSRALDQPDRRQVYRHLAVSGIVSIGFLMLCLTAGAILHVSRIVPLF